MEWVIYFMIALMAFAPYLGLPVLINSEDAGDPADSIDNASGRNVFPNSDPPNLGREKDDDGPGGGTGPDSTKT